MSAVFKVDLEEILNNNKPVIIELGCGPKKKAGRIGIDILPLEGVDIVSDLESGLAFFPDNSVDEVHSRSLLEHVDNLGSLMKEIWRVLKPDGKKVLFVPHFSSPYYYSDYTHQRFFGLYTFQYFSKQQTMFKRKVPSFYNDFSFTVESIRMDFKSNWWVRKRLKKLFQFFVNLHPYFMEMYEESFCYLIPCNGMTVVLRPDK
jgi:predicted SAM-dependent methyltransferase